MRCEPRYFFENGEETLGTLVETRNLLMDNRLEELADVADVQEHGISGALDKHIRHILPGKDANQESRLAAGWSATEVSTVRGWLMLAGQVFGERAAIVGVTDEGSINKIKNLLNRWRTTQL